LRSLPMTRCGKHGGSRIRLGRSVGRAAIATALLMALAGCSAGSPTHPLSTPRSPSGGCVTSRLVWSIVASDGTAPFVAPELRVDQTLTLEASTVAVGCTALPFTATWTSSNPHVARVVARGAGRYADLSGSAPGATVVKVAIVGSDGNSAAAMQEFRIN
jgi:hypothetical protein